MSVKRRKVPMRWCSSAPSNMENWDKSNIEDNVFEGNTSRSNSFKTEKRQHQSPDVMNRTDKSLIAYGVKYLEEKPDRLRLLRINSKSRLHSLSRLRKSLSDGDSGFDSADSSSASSSGNASSPTASESSVTLDMESQNEEEAWLDGEAYPFENLAMSGGGAKGYAYIGALKALEDSGALPNIKRFVGTSAGAVIGGLLVVGATPQEIADFFSCDVKKLFQDKNAAMCLSIPRLLTKFGMNSGQRFYEIYGDFLAKKTGDPDITFDTIYRTYRKELCVTVTNLSRMRSEFCHYTTTPDLPIRTAVKISMAFPGVYECMKTDLFGNGRNLYVDGGTLENFPVQYFDKTDEATGKPVYNEKTIGLYLMSEDQFSHKIWLETFREEMQSFPSYLPDTKLARERLKDELRRRKKKDKLFDTSNYTDELKSDPYFLADDGKCHMRHYAASNKDLIDIKGPKNYFKAMLSTLLISQKHVMVQPADVKRTIGINCGYIDTKDTGVEPGDRAFMIRQGYEQTRNFLKHYIRHKHAHKKSQDAKAKPVKPTSLPISSDVNFRLGATPSPSPSSEISQTNPDTSYPAMKRSSSSSTLRDTDETIKTFYRLASTIDLTNSTFTKL